eukprot:7800931-Alexandrium_andersonii.AAC.1
MVLLLCPHAACGVVAPRVGKGPRRILGMDAKARIGDEALRRVAGDSELGTVDDRGQKLRNSAQDRGLAVL